MTELKRRDTDPARRLEELRKAYEHLRAERIRAESDVKRLIEETDDHNRKLVDEFSTLIHDIEARLQSLGEER
jgi:chromosome segregation ATPase